VVVAARRSLVSDRTRSRSPIRWQKPPPEIHARFRRGPEQSQLRGIVHRQQDQACESNAVTQFESDDGSRAFPCFRKRPAPFKRPFARQLLTTFDFGRRGTPPRFSNGRGRQGCCSGDVPGARRSRQHTMKFSTHTKIVAVTLVADGTVGRTSIQVRGDGPPPMHFSDPDSARTPDPMEAEAHAHRPGSRPAQAGAALLRNRNLPIKYPFELDVRGPCQTSPAGAMEKNTGAILSLPRTRDLF